MPKRVDHDQRRAEIVDAMLRLAVREGMTAVSIRNVADEAGCSTRPVQYYFADKAELIAAGHARVLRRQAEQINRAVRRLGEGARPREIVTAIVDTFLPTTRLARESLILFYSFYAVELTDATLRIRNDERGPDRLARTIADQIRSHHGAALPAELDPDAEASLLVAAIPSIASAVVVGSLKPTEAKALLHHAIDRLLPDHRSRV